MKTSLLRGQVSPIWIGGIFGCLMLIFLTFCYGNVVRSQIRAQNAADSAANAVVAIQSQQWNQMNEALYAGAVEEYRIRNILESLRIVASWSGGCRVIGRSCPIVYQNLRKAYLRSLYRYDLDIRELSQITASSKVENIYNDGQNIVQRLKASCSNPQLSAKSLDCSFDYAITGFIIRPKVGSVLFAPQTMKLPGYSHTGTTMANADALAPIAVEVSVCTMVHPFLGGFWPMNTLPAVPIIARAAATDVMLSQNWIQPGSVTNPLTGMPYQPVERYGDSDPSGQNWYEVDYGGNATIADQVKNTLYAPIKRNELSVRMGWWGSIPIYPFTGPIDRTKIFAGTSCS